MTFGFRLEGLLFASLSLLVPGSVSSQVVFSEIHYHPPVQDGRAVEFVEIHNAGGAEVSLAGWRIQGAVDLEIPSNIVIAPGGHVLACKDSSALFSRFGASTGEVLPNYVGSLDDGGESIELVNADGAIVDALTYDDRLPWPEDADGKGASLERHCATAPAWDPLNWTARQPPGPGKANPDPICPPPPHITPPVVITELLYHPGRDAAVHSSLEDGEDEEYVEIHNPGTSPVALGDWKFSDGIDFRFPPMDLAPGAYLVVARNAARLREEYGITNVIGDFSGRLSNGGERIALVDARNDYVDSVVYFDSGEWPHAADGYGRSLERVVINAPSSDPATWESAASVPSADFRHLQGEGSLGQGISQRLLITIDGEGEAIVDNVVVVNVDAPSVNLITNGAFDESLEGWIAAGSASRSELAPGLGVGGTGALRLIGNGPCPSADCGAANSVNARLPTGLPREAQYRVTVDVKHIRGSPAISIGLFRGASASLGEITSAGGPNTVLASAAPPFIHRVGRFPVEPKSTDPVWITATVRNGADGAVLTYDAGAGETQAPMADDGLHRDGAPGDGIFGVQIPPFPHDAKVRYRIVATRGAVAAGYPRSIEPGTWLLKELAGYYVNDNQPDAQLPVYHILLDNLSSPDFLPLNEYLNCTVPVPGHFAFKGELWSDVGVRFRGHTACAELFRKKNLKVVFNRGKLFGRLSKLNLNGMWTDKALVRERLAWEFVKEIGVPYFHTEYSRVHINGIYHGLFLYLDHHGDELLDRNALDEGNLYLSRQPPRDRPDPRGVEPHETEDGFKLAWEKETNEQSDFLDIMDFVNAMHAGGGETVAFWKERTFEEMNLGYQLTQVVLNNIDSFAKNHFLYHDLEADRWGIITWDLDLTFGKFFTPRAVKIPERPVGTLNDIMLSGHGELGLPEDLNPWFGASVNRNPIYHHLVDFLFKAGTDYYQRAYLIRLHDILMEKYRNEVYDPKLDALAVFLQAEELEDHARWGRYPSNVPGFPEDMLSNIEVMKRQIELHRQFLLDYLDLFHREVITSHPRAKITEVMYWPEAGNDSLEFLEVLNTSGRDIDISGWSTTGVAFTFPPGSMFPAGAHLVLAAGPAAFKSRYPDFPAALVFGPYAGKLANEGEEIRLLDAGRGYPATIDLLQYRNESPWPEVTPGQSIELTKPGPDRDNDPPENWIASRKLGGTPGSTAPVFIRSDSNGDYAINLTDSIAILSHLFLGGPSLTCLDAGDADDDGSLTTQDAVYVLNHLFLSGPAPPAPYPEEGLDTTADGLVCG